MKKRFRNYCSGKRNKHINKGHTIREKGYEKVDVEDIINEEG